MASKTDTAWPVRDLIVLKLHQTFNTHVGPSSFRRRYNSHSLENCGQFGESIRWQMMLVFVILVVSYFNYSNYGIFHPAPKIALTILEVRVGHFSCEIFENEKKNQFFKRSFADPLNTHKYVIRTKLAIHLYTRIQSCKCKLNPTYGMCIMVCAC